MGQRTQVTLIDDYDGGDADQQDISFALDGVEYLIDLSDENAEQLREDIGRWAEHARRQGKARARRRVATGAPRSQSAGERALNQEIRAWWRRQGNEIGDRGRIASEIVHAFEAARRSKSA